MIEREQGNVAIEESEMRLPSMAAVVLAIVCVADGRADPPDKPPLGSADFVPTPDRPMGWRGDGNGRFPAADPPLAWGRLSKAVNELGARRGSPGPTTRASPCPKA